MSTGGRKAFRPKSLLWAGLHFLGGLALGLLLLEAIFRANPTILLRGMALPAPLDLPLTSQTYTVRYSDADAIYWRADLIRPIAPEQDAVEAVVRFR